MNKTPSISVIMRSKNDGKVIEATLNMLFAQTIQDFELLNVDSGSTDGTLEIIKRFPTKLTQIEPEQYDPGTVLNTMTGKATGELVVFLNSDATPVDDHWLENLVRAFEDKTVVVTYGRQLPRKDAYDLVAFDYERAYPADPDPKISEDFISFASAAFRRRIWEKFRFYEGGLSEDYAWANVLIENGYRVTYVPDSMVYHSHNLNTRNLFRKEFFQNGVAMVYVKNQQANLMKEIIAFLKSVARDYIYAVPKLKIRSLLYSPYFRGVQHLAFYLGKRAGVKRYHGK